MAHHSLIRSSDMDFPSIGIVISVKSQNDDLNRGVFRVVRIKLEIVMPIRELTLAYAGIIHNKPTHRIHCIHCILNYLIMIVLPNLIIIKIKLLDFSLFDKFTIKG
jgi:hypothetical protein